MNFSLDKVFFNLYRNRLGVFILGGIFLTRLFLTGLILFFGFIYIFIIPEDPVGFKIFMKLIPMALIIILVLQTKTAFSNTYQKWILFGLFVCMIADAVIYWFLPGLITFFFGHLLLIIAFRHIWRQQIPKWVAFILLFYGALMAILLVGSQIKAGEIILAFAILAYITVILIMGWHAIATRLPLAIIGAIFFMISDSILAIDRFIEPLPFRDALVMGTYYFAQFMIAKSVGSPIKQSNLIK